MTDERRRLRQCVILAIAMTLALACTFTPSPSPSPTPEPPTLPTATPAAVTVQLFFVALEDNGLSGRAIGCGDSIVPVQVQLPYTEDLPRATLETLLAVQGQFYGESGLYNGLDQSTLQVEEISTEGGRAIVNLSGTLMLGGVCDNPRVEAQIEETMLQFPGVDEVLVFVNGVPLEELLSQQG